jgi:glycosyltransferase involved in cell wall biosynthesis
MRVLFLNITGQMGGAERSLLDLLASLRRCAPTLEVDLALAEGGPLVAAAEALGVRTRLLPMPQALLRLGDTALRGRGRWQVLTYLLGGAAETGLAMRRYLAQLRSLVRRVGPDVVHSNAQKFHLLTGLAKLRRPVVWHLRDYVGERPVMRRALALLSRRAAGAVGISESVSADARSVLGRLPVETVYNAIDTDEFAPGPGDGAWLDRLAGLPPAALVLRIGLVATFARWKGHDVFVRAAAAAAARLPAARFYIVGGPIYQTAGSQWSAQELTALAGPLAAEHRLGLTGFQARTADVYRALDIAVHASTRPEPFGRSVVEAMACGRPTVVANAGGAAELIRHDHDALGVPPGNADALAETLVRLSTDEPLRRRLAANARQSALARFNRARLGPEMLALYRQLLAAPSH